MRTLRNGCYKDKVFGHENKKLLSGEDRLAERDILDGCSDKCIARGICLAVVSLLEAGSIVRAEKLINCIKE